MDKKEAQQKAESAFQQFFKDEVEKVLHNHESRPDEFKSADKIVNYWSRLNAALASGSGFIPGPIGMIAAIPTLIAEIRNQIYMLKDIAAFYRKEDQLDKNLTLLILFYTSGNAGGKFIVFRGGKVLLAKATPKIIQKLLVRLSINLSQKAIGRFLAVWVPVLGSIALGAWSFETSKSIGNYAISIFSKEISNVDIEDDSEFDCNIPVQSEDELFNVSLNTCKAMIEMMYADYVGSDAELQIIQASIDETLKVTPEFDAKYGFTNEIHGYMDAYKNTRNSDIDYSVLKSNQDYKLNLISLLIAVAKASDGVSSDEISYIENVCTNIGYDYKYAMATLLSV